MLKLYHCKGQVVKRDELLTQLWGKDDQYVSRSLDVFISSLRKYFSGDSDIHIDTVRGIGIRLTIHSRIDTNSPFPKET